MKTEENNLDRFKGKNPFFVPDGYIENLTTNVMSQLPEKNREEARRISLAERVRPWLYMAAVFAGLGLFFKAIIGTDTEKDKTGLLLVQSGDTSQSKAAILATEDAEYLEYLEDRYSDYLLAEELTDSE